MKCPVDGGTLVRVKLDAALPAFQCGECQGHWLRFGDYLGWREQQRTNIPETTPAADRVEPESWAGGLRRCPDCRGLLARYYVGHGVPFSLDQCGRCNGIWLDGKEWETLRDRGLHDDLNRIFGPGWQHEVRGEEERLRTEAQFRRQLGESDFERTRDFSEWVAGHPRRSEILAYVRWVMGA
jgi:Zn-finger nucleic acid-binding protein